MNPLELPQERLATTDSRGWRVKLHPLEVSGRFRRGRTLVQACLIAFFLVTPWTTFQGTQSVLLDLPNRRFTFLGNTLWAHDAPLIFFVFAGVAFTLAFVAVTFGRAWCGWACPQTVFIDGVFRRIETLIEGKSHERQRLDRAPWNASKVLKRSLKWIAFATASLVISNSFLAYFVGAKTMIDMVRSPPAENPGAFSLTLFATAIVLFDFGWFREQFCIIMCPYGRFQSVLMDETSLVVMYDQSRGEPRRGADPNQKSGDCINCYRCVSVCPVGIDIRRGTQLECISCTACIDACNDIMTKTKKPEGLIRYGREVKASFYQFKPIFFFVIAISIWSGLAIATSTRENLSFAVLRAGGEPFQLVDEAHITNRFVLEANNHLASEIVLSLEIQEGQVVAAQNPVTLQGGESRRIEFFVRYPKSKLSAGHGKVNLKLVSSAQSKTFEQEVPIVGPLH